MAYPFLKYERVIKTKRLIAIILIIVCCFCSYIILAHIPSSQQIEEPKPTPPTDSETTIFEFPPQSLPNEASTSSQEEESLEPSSQEIPESSESEISLFEVPEEEPFTVKLYNEHGTGFNQKDAQLYFDDLYYYLSYYRVEGLWISAALAQAYTEGGAGKVGIYTKTNNCFGITAGPNWTGRVYARGTGQTYDNWALAKASRATGLYFRVYSSMEESVVDYIALISTKYPNALNTISPQLYLYSLVLSGYGEKATYNMWCSVIKQFNLIQYDLR